MRKILHSYKLVLVVLFFFLETPPFAQSYKNEKLAIFAEEYGTPASTQGIENSLTNSIFPFDVQLRFGFGNFEHETDGSNVDDDTDAGYFALQFEGFSKEGFGGGFRLEGINSDDDLFQNLGAVDAEASIGEIFPYVSYRAERAGEYSIPVRFGPLFHNYTLEDPTAEIEYATFGFRLEAEPEFYLINNEGRTFSLYFNFGFGYGNTEIENDPFTFEADSDATLLNFDLGTRFKVDELLIGLGYVFRKNQIDDSDVVGGSFYRGVDTRFSGIQLTVGARF